MLDAINAGVSFTARVCSTLAVVTDVANGLRVSVVDPDTGDTSVTTRRDSMAFKPRDAGDSIPAPPAAPAQQSIAPPRPLPSSRLKRRREDDAEALRDAQRVASWLASRDLRPSSAAPAASRLDAVRLRIVAKRSCVQSVQS